jgi:hypothetical protein
MSLKARVSARVSPLVERVKNEPIAVGNGAALALGIAVSFGLPIAPEQKIELSGAFVGLANWWARSKSVPVNKLVTGEVLQSGPGEPVTVIAPDGATTTVGATS